jgi:hypothetical protein
MVMVGKHQGVAMLDRIPSYIFSAICGAISGVGVILGIVGFLWLF